MSVLGENAQALWVSSESVQALLHLLVDRLESSDERGASKTRSLVLNEKTWPALFRATRESEKETLWTYVQSMCRWGWLQVTPQAALASDSGYATSPRVSVADLMAIRKAVGRPVRILSLAERWRQALERGLDASPSVIDASAAFYIDLPGYSMDEIVVQLNKLKSLNGKPLLLRQVSSLLFWGMSKVLDKKKPLVAALLELEECPFPDAPIQLHVYLPRQGFTDILFIENLMTYEQTIRASGEAIGGLAMVYASGFKGGASRLRLPDGASLYYSHLGDLTPGATSLFEQWLYGQAASSNVYFWGDLDWSGMRILNSLRNTFGDVGAWRPGYRQMLEALSRGEGHAALAAEKAGQLELLSCGCSYADAELLPALRSTARFLDQELFVI